MRTWWGWALSLLGVLGMLAGAAVMVVLGPDSRFTTGPHAIETDATAVVTAPGVITWSGLKVDVLAEVPVRKPVFVGVGNAVDVQDFVSRTRRLEITRFERPWTIDTREVDGQPNLPGAATSLDWWIDSADGLGGASVSTQLPDQTVSIAVVSVGSSNLTGLTVTVAYGVKGGFAKGAALVLLGAALVWLGVLVRRGLWRLEDVDPDEDDEPLDEVEEVVYVYVDDDGVEHEISAEEAEDLDVVEEVVEIGTTADPDPDPAPEVEVVAEAEAEADVEPQSRTEPIAAAPQVDGVLTAAEIAELITPTPKPGAAAGVPPDAEEVVYVYVDEDGVEHELTEDELAEFEVVDDEEEDQR